MYFNQRGDISTLNGRSLKLVDKFSETASHQPKMISTRDWRKLGQQSIDHRSYGSQIYPIKYVIYWPSTEPSIKRCTCVNKRKNSGSRWTWDNNITRCPGRFELVGDKMSNWDQLQTEGFGPSLAHGWATQPRWERGAAMVGRTWVKITVRPCLHSPLTHKKHHPFENKEWEIIFL